MTQPVVLAVCTGNVCRSPYVERMLAARLPDGRFTFASAGLHAMAGSAMAPAMAKRLRAAGGSDQGFAARQLRAEMVRAASLIIALERHHRATIVSVVPDARDRTFTLRELGRLIPTLGPSPTSTGERLLWALPALAVARTRAPGTVPADDDVPDPFGGGRKDYAEAVAIMTPAIEAVASLLRG